ncbi:hypothetical protein AMTRI_Chr13g123400 [Amborella trichopoda]
MFDPCSLDIWNPFHGFFPSSLGTNTTFSSSHSDSSDSATSDFLNAELEDGRVLQISGERKEVVEEKNDKYERKIHVNEVKAAMENGILTVTVPKVEAPKSEIKSIEILG